MENDGKYPSEEPSLPGPDDVLEDYLDYDDPEEWLINEVCEYLFNDLPAEEIDDRLERFDEVMQAERERMLSDNPRPEEVALYTISVETGDAREYLSFKGCPSAALLLESCTHMADAGDNVRVDVVYGDSSHSTFSLTWPFPMWVAVEATSIVAGSSDSPDIDEFMTLVEEDRTPREFVAPATTGTFYDQDADYDLTEDRENGDVVDVYWDSPTSDAPSGLVVFGGEQNSLVVTGLATGFAIGVAFALGAARRLVRAARN